MAHNTNGGNGTDAAALAGARVTDAGGRQASIVSVEQPDGMREAHAWLRIDGGAQLLVPVSLLMRDSEGGYRLPLAFAPATAERPLQMTLPVMEEQLQVDKREVDTGRGVRLHKTVSEEEKRIEQSLLREQIEVERVPVGRVLAESELPQARYEGDTLVVPVLEEVLVVQKQVVLKEEVRITRRRHQETVPRSERVRVEHVTVERFGDEGRA